MDDNLTKRAEGKKPEEETKTDHRKNWHEGSMKKGNKGPSFVRKWGNIGYLHPPGDFKGIGQGLPKLKTSRGGGRTEGERGGRPVSVASLLGGKK